MNFNTWKYCVLSFVLLFLSVETYGQVHIEGIIIDNVTQRPLSYANIIAHPTKNAATSEVAHRLQFDISDQNGRYDLNLNDSLSYLIISSYLGYKSDTFHLRKSDLRVVYHDVSLVPEGQTIREVVVKGTTPVRVKKDTITFEVGFFLNGNETNLGDVLSNLPGISVSDDGTVFSGGQRVKKILVEGQPFFTGGTKLGVENIPSEIIESIDFIDNYQPIEQLSSFNSSGQKVLNVNLLENSKNILFGNIETGIGDPLITHDLHLNLFKFNPLLGLVGISDLNNIGRSPLSLQEIVDLHGGIESLIDDPESFFSNPSLSSFINDSNSLPFKRKSSKFQAIDINSKLGQSNPLKITGYFQEQQNISQIAEINQYISPLSEYFENSNEIKSDKGKNGMFHINQGLRISDNQSLSISLFTTYNEFVSDLNRDIIRPDSESVINKKTFLNNVGIDSKVVYIRKIDDSFALKSVLEFKVDENTEMNTWFSSQNSFFSRNIDNGDMVQEAVQNSEYSNHGIIGEIELFKKISPVLTTQNGVFIKRRSISGNRNVDVFNSGAMLGTLGSFGLDVNIEHLETGLFNRLSYNAEYFSFDAQLSIGRNTLKSTKLSSLSKTIVLPELSLRYNVPLIGQVVVFYKKSNLRLQPTNFYVANEIVDFNVIQKGIGHLTIPNSNYISIRLSNNSNLSFLNFSFKYEQNFGNIPVSDVVTDGFQRINYLNLRKSKHQKLIAQLEYDMEWGSTGLTVDLSDKISDFFLNQKALFSQSLDCNIALSNELYWNSQHRSKMTIGVNRNLQIVGPNSNRLLQFISTISHSYNFKKIDFDLDGKILFFDRSIQVGSSIIDLNIKFKYSLNESILIGFEANNVINNNEISDQQISNSIFSEQSIHLQPRQLIIYFKGKF